MKSHCNNQEEAMIFYLFKESMWMSLPITIIEAWKERAQVKRMKNVTSIPFCQC